MAPSPPKYDLAEIKRLVARGTFVITRTAAADAGALYLDETDIVECVSALEARDFYKSMRARANDSLFQDVYKKRFHGYAIYVKVQIGANGRAVVVSFKQDESA